MSEIRWTDAQRAAIDARGNILVSAAAGSGKTAVLVQRVMEMIESECDIDEMLIVTFTKSAATQMREKITQAIEKKLEENPFNARFQREQLLLGKAQITTIDAFCADVVKNTFQHLDSIDIAMNYKNLDGAEFAVLSTQVLDEVLGEFYDAGEESFRALMDVFTKGKNDLDIYAVINTLHNDTSAYIDRSAWMAEKTDYFLQSDISASPWGRLLLADMKEKLLLAADYNERALEIAREDEATAAALQEVLAADGAAIARALEAVEQRQWADLCEMKATKFGNYPRTKKGIDADLKAAAKSYRDCAKDTFFAALKNLIESEADFARDNRLLHPVVQELQKLFDAYEQRLFERKLEQQSFEFSDIAYLALRILTKEGAPTPAALEYRKKYKAVLVDEYQDTNGVQDAIFTAISDNNLFVVGDVKQSIYRFRQAMPEIFIGKRKALAPYEKGKESGYILLKNNFRSEKPVTDFVNFLFQRLMSEELGDVDYNEDEYLIPGANESDEGAAAVEMHLLEDLHLPDRRKVKKHEYEAHYIADYIREKVTSGEPLQIGGELRPTDYGDYCVLVRSKTHMAQLQEAFEQAGVPCTGVAGENLFDTPEIMLVMSFLRMVDNPLRDVDLIAVLYSEIFGFTPEELALVRIENRRGSFYGAVRALAAKGNRKCADFIEQLEGYRTLAATHEPAEFLRRLYEKTSLPEMMSAREDGETKKANLFKFISIAALYTSGGYYSLTGLVRFLEKVRESRTDITTAYVPESGSKVKIMTVHASKGLEFPVVIFAYTNSSNHHNGSNIVLNREYGIGLKPKYPEDNARYDTLSYSAVHLANVRSDMAEEIRTLYVALTRPKAKLVITGTFDGAPLKDGSTPRESKLWSIAHLAANSRGEIRRGWMRANNNYLYWMCACALMHPQAEQLRAYALHPDGVRASGYQGKLRIVLPEYFPSEPAPAVIAHTAQADAQLKEKLLQRFAFRYAYEGAENIDSKMTPSAVAESAQGVPEYHFEPPQFMQKQRLNAAQRGTAMHRFMEKVQRFTPFDFEAEKRAMLQKGFLSEEQAQVLDKKALERFFESDIAARMAAAARCEREYAFSYLEQAGFFDAQLPAKLQKERVFVDGMIDAVFEEEGAAHIVDYKTDRVQTPGELTERYEKQIALYKRAIETIWGIPVKSCHLYSFYLNKDITVEF